MNCQHPYTADDKMISLIADNYQLIQVMSRFGIRVGFGEKTVSEVCRDFGVDCSTFLSVINFVYHDDTGICNDADISLPALLHYLRQSHIYFLEYCLPAIRRKLLDGIRMRATDVSFLILRFFDEYTAEARTHMEHEEKTVFIYVNDLLQGHMTDNYRLATYSDHHEQVSDKIRELKSIILRYCPNDADANLLNAALYDIYRCEQELDSHCRVEDCLLVPAIQRLEEKVKSQLSESGEDE